MVVEPQAPVFKPSSAEYSHKEEDEEEEEEDDTPHFPATAGKAGFSDYSDDGGDGAAPVTPTLPCSVCGRKFAEESRLVNNWGSGNVVLLRKLSNLNIFYCISFSDRLNT